MTRAIPACACLLLIAAAPALAQKGPARSRYTDETFGFTIETPRFPGLGQKPGGTVLFTGVAEAGFAPSVNVVIQPIATDRKGYRALSADGSRTFKVNEDRDATVSGREAIRVDFEGEIGGRKLPMLSLAVMEKDRVILVTCAATVEEFDALAPEFRACLDGFKLRDGKTP